MHDGRDYSLFGVLAGVRRDMNVQIVEPSGVPKNLSKFVQSEYLRSKGERGKSAGQSTVMVIHLVCGLSYGLRVSLFFYSMLCTGRAGRAYRINCCTARQFIFLLNQVVGLQLNFGENHMCKPPRSDVSL